MWIVSSRTFPAYGMVGNLSLDSHQKNQCTNLSNEASLYIFLSPSPPLSALSIQNTLTLNFSSFYGGFAIIGDIKHITSQNLISISSCLRAENGSRGLREVALLAAEERVSDTVSLR